MLSTRDIIYDARFQKRTFAGYGVELPANLCRAFEYPIWYHDDVEICEFREFLNSAGPYRFSHNFSKVSGTIYFSRERSAMMYKLKFL